MPLLQQALDLTFEVVGEDSDVSLSPPPMRAEASEPESESELELAVEISTTDYSLTVYEGRVPLVTFPVGLGRDAATPLGSFRVANMIVDPDWYNRGHVVKAGAADNPLGNRWMGLGDGEGATPYGIHPTSEAESIGQNVSEGCVRMRPEDAVELFEMIEIGTPVRIVQ